MLLFKSVFLTLVFLKTFASAANIWFLNKHIKRFSSPKSSITGGGILSGSKDTNDSKTSEVVWNGDIINITDNVTKIEESTSIIKSLDIIQSNDNETVVDNEAFGGNSASKSVSKSASESMSRNDNDDASTFLEVDNVVAKDENLAKSTLKPVNNINASEINTAILSDNSIINNGDASMNISDNSVKTEPKSNLLIIVIAVVALLAIGSTVGGFLIFKKNQLDEVVEL